MCVRLYHKHQGHVFGSQCPSELSMSSFVTWSALPSCWDTMGMRGAAGWTGRVVCYALSVLWCGLLWYLVQSEVGGLVAKHWYTADAIFLRFKETCRQWCKSLQDFQSNLEIHTLGLLLALLSLISRGHSHIVKGRHSVSSNCTTAKEVCCLRPFLPLPPWS